MSYTNTLNIKKTEYPYVEQVQDAETEKETKKEDDEYDLHKKYKIDNAATEQKKQGQFINLFDDLLDENNPFNDTMKTEDIFIDDNLFDDTDQKDIKKSL